MSSAIEQSFDRNVLSLRFNRPEKKNALTLAMYDALVAAMRDAEGRDDVRVLLLSGSGGTFTSGNDLADFAANPQAGEDSSVMRFLFAMQALSKPVVAAVDGLAVGVGATMLLHCDLVYAADRARFLMPFVNLGLCPENAASLLLPLRAGGLLANELLLFGEPFDAKTAQEAGLVNRIVPAAEVLAIAQERAAALATKPPAALRATKRLLKEAQGTSVVEAIQREAKVFAERLSSPEAQEAFTAFFEKRKPDFSRF